MQDRDLHRWLALPQRVWHAAPAAARVHPRGELNIQNSTHTRRHDTTFYPSPGSFNSSDRFARLAMLKSTANLVPWQ